jgi:hypothetical protein
MSIRSVGAGVLLLSCIATVAGCSPRMQMSTGSASAASTAGPATPKQTAIGEDAGAYPYLLRIGAAVNRVEREPDAERVRIDFVRWSGSNYGGREAVFRVTNPADHAVLVWQVRQQVSVSLVQSAASSRGKAIIQGHGWESATIARHGSVEFPTLSPAEGDWRVCLLYSREALDSQAPNRHFGGTYESIGPRMHEVAE